VEDMLALSLSGTHGTPVRKTRNSGPKPPIGFVSRIPSPTLKARHPLITSDLAAAKRFSLSSHPARPHYLGRGERVFQFLGALLMDLNRLHTI